MSGYSPACGNEWKPGICRKPRVKCGYCNQRRLLPMTDQVIHDHLTGKMTIGGYPLLNDSCHFLAADFDEADLQGDAKAFMQSCHELGISAALEIFRSNNGAQAGKNVSAATGPWGARLKSRKCKKPKIVQWKPCNQERSGFFV